MTSIIIPRTIRSAQAKLTELGELATATEWHRAAIVAAFVSRGHAGRPAENRAESHDSPESAQAFSRRGIVGLTSANTVLIYLDAWASTGLPARAPGQKVTIPTDGWPPTALEDKRFSGVDDRDAIIAAAEASGTGPTKAVDIAKNKAAMAAAIKGPPAVAAAAARALAEAHPQIAAEAVVSNDAADAAVSEVRTERLRSRPEMAEMRERTQARDDRMDAEIADATTQMERSEDGEHEGNIHLRSAAMFLAKASLEFERNPELVDGQQEFFATSMRRIEHYVSLLRGEARWTGDDDAFLRDLGIKGVTS